MKLLYENFIKKLPIVFIVGVEAAAKPKLTTTNSAETPGVRRSTINTDGKSESIEKTNNIAVDVPK